MSGIRGPQQFRQSQLAQWLYLLGQAQYVGYWFEQAILLNPHNIIDKISRLDWLLKAGKYGIAKDYADELISLGHKDYRLWLIRGQALILSGNNREGVRSLVDVLERQPMQSEALLWLRQQDETLFYENGGNQLLENLQSIPYKWPINWLHLAIYWYGAAPDNSQEYLSKAINEGFRDIHWLKTLVTQNMLADSGETQQALTNIENLIANEQTLLEQNPAYQQFISQTAKDIVASQMQP